MSMAADARRQMFPERTAGDSTLDWARGTYFTMRGTFVQLLRESVLLAASAGLRKDRTAHPASKIQLTGFTRNLERGSRCRTGERKTSVEREQVCRTLTHAIMDLVVLLASRVGLPCPSATQRPLSSLRARHRRGMHIADPTLSTRLTSSEPLSAHPRRSLALVTAHHRGDRRTLIHLRTEVEGRYHRSTRCKYNLCRSWRADPLG